MPSGKPIDWDRELLEELYCNQRLKIPEIARILGQKLGSTEGAIRRLGLRRPPGKDRKWRLFIVDEEFAEEVASYRWYSERNGYLIRQGKTSAGWQTLLLHREVWRLAYGEVPEELNHKNGLKHDCRLENLEPATRRLNNLERRYRVRNLPTGVYQRGNKYRARLGYKSLGTYSTVDDARSAYLQAKSEAIAEERGKL